MTRQNLKSAETPIKSKRVINAFIPQLERDRDQYAQSVEEILKAASADEEVKGIFSEKLAELTKQVSHLLDQLQVFGKSGQAKIRKVSPD